MSQSTISIRVASTADEARAALADGYEPVECAFGGESVVGPLGLDHHGALADLPPVCEQAWAMRSGGTTRTRFVATGAPDADASLAMALLALAEVGELETQSLVPVVAASDLGRWADLSAEGRDGAIILAWHARQRARGAYPSARLVQIGCDYHGSHPDLVCRDCYAGDPQRERWALAVRDWADLLALPGEDPELQRALASEAERVRLARDARVTADIGCADGATVCTMRDYSDRLVADHPHGIALIESPVMGADVWYADHPTLRGYVAWQAESQRISISLCPGTACGEGLLGLGDLASAGWGGRPEIIGSPRGVAMIREDAVRTAKLLAARINEVARG